MSYGDYVTPAAVSVYIGSLHVDDCYDIRYNTEDSSSPVFSYASSHYATAVEGKTLVSGSIATVFRYQGYLATAIAEARKVKAQSDKARLFGDLADVKNRRISEWFRKLTNASREEKFKLLAAAAVEGPRFLRQVSALSYLVDTITGDGNQEEVPSVLDTMRVGRGRIDPISIWIFYGDLDEQHAADKLEDVVLVGESKTASAGAGAGGGVSASGAPMLEIYPFFAKRVRKYVMGANGWQKRLS